MNSKESLPQWVSESDLEDFKEINKGAFLVLTKNSRNELTLMLGDQNGTYILDFGGHLNPHISNETFRDCFKKINSINDFHRLSLEVRERIEVMLRAS